jgi:hypothetical protein
MSNFDSSDKMRRRILDEIERQKKRSAAHSPADHARLLGAFLTACLTNLGRTPADFARVLDIDQELADAILGGYFPVSEIDDEFLAEIARAVQYEPNLLRAMLGRTIQRQSPASRGAAQDSE